MKYHIITIGCQMNKADSERIASYLENLGYEWSEDRAQADLVVLTTCGVRQSAEDRIYGLIPKIKKENKNVKIILTGCLSEREDVRKRLDGKVDFWLAITELSSLAKKLGEINYIEGESNYLNLSPKYNSKFSAFVPIGNGCNNFCTYCVVPYARGREVYRSANEIVNEVKKLARKGYKEINLIAQNVNSYKSEDINFPKLLKMIDDIEGDFWIRFATSHPKDMNDELIQVIADCDKICEYVHLPAQAGDNEVLKNMNRKYTIEHYKKLIEKIRDKIPGVAVSTDIIVGFPGETEKQFQNTIKLFNEVQYDLAYIAQYSPRYGTKAEKMEDNVDLDEKKRRNDLLEDLLRKSSKEKNQKYIGKEVDILVEGKNKDGFYYGKTRTYKNTRIKNQNVNIKIGDIIKVKINNADVFGLEGNLVSS